MFKNIPKKMHFYWEGEEFSYLHYLSIKSFVEHNPDWECIIHTNKETVESFDIPWNTGEQSTKYTGKNYFSKLQNLKISLREVDFPTLGIPSDIHPVFKSDLLRWNLLSTEGGGWSDSDIIYTKPLAALESQFNIDMDCCVCIADIPTPWIHSHTHDDQGRIQLRHENRLVRHHIIGFYLASENNKFFADIAAKSKLVSTLSYQMFGNRMLEHYYPTMESIRETFPDMVIENLNREALYVYQWFETKLLFSELSDKHNQEHIIGVHWYNGDNDTRDFINTFDEKYLENYSPTTITSMLCL